LEPDSRERSEKTHAECSEQQTRRIIKIDLHAYRGLLHNRDFRLLWLGQIQTAIGDWIIVAVLFAFVDQLSGGKSYGITLMMLAKFLPAVLLGFLAGVFIDRFDRKKTLVISDLARAVLYVILPFSPNLLVVCILVFIIETFTVIYGPARDASVPDLVEPEHLMSANSLNQLTLYASMAFGTAIAGSIIALITWLGRINPEFIGKYIDPNVAVFIIDAFSCVVSAYLIYLIKGFKRVPKEEREKYSSRLMLQDLKEGFNYLRQTKLTRTILILTLACFLGGGTMYVLTIGFVKYALSAGDATFMYILTVLLSGMMIGSVLAGLLGGPFRKWSMMGYAISLFGACVVAFAVITALWLSFIVVFAGGVFMGYATVGMITVLHEKLEEEFRGRAFAAIQMVMRASIFASILLAGPIADLINLIGRRLGIGPLSFLIFRLGGSFEGQIDGTVVNFRYLLNGPQIVLLVGGMVILGAGIYGKRALSGYDTQKAPGGGESGYDTQEAPGGGEKCPDEEVGEGPGNAAPEGSD